MPQGKLREKSYIVIYEFSVLYFLTWDRSTQPGKIQSLLLIRIVIYYW